MGVWLPVSEELQYGDHVENIKTVHWVLLTLSYNGEYALFNKKTLVTYNREK